MTMTERLKSIAVIQSKGDAERFADYVEYKLRLMRILLANSKATDQKAELQIGIAWMESTRDEVLPKHLEDPR